ncbi:MAG TPA: alpha-amylase family glycosyl hydrolase [Rectinemataceae bacterium]|nr:alpha-amylase family glycosyl hydrolase [Rectinemataceae bacterium]
METDETQAATREAFQDPTWAREAVFYHLYPLGLLGAPGRNPALGNPPHEAEEGPSRIDALLPWVEHLVGMGFTAIYLGPVFESTSHGYDTIDYYRVDRRLGDASGLRRFVEACHARGLRVVLDAVMNHVGRDHPAFKDLQSHGRASAYASWFAKLDFSRRGPAGDDFAYEGWHGHYELVKLDGSNPELREHLFGAVASWIRDFDIDGLRLDAADCLSFDFIEELAARCARLKPEFWLMGEVVAGDYRLWARPGRLHSVTNYEAYKGLWSSLVDKNYWEIDWTFKRQFGPITGPETGMYRQLALYNFVDNHDVDRVATILGDSARLKLLYVMLFTMPGIPSVYYGSEWGIGGARRPGSDEELRPTLSLSAMSEKERMGRSEHPALCGWINRLIRLRESLPALRQGSYRPVLVGNEQFVYWRDLDGRPPSGSPRPGLEEDRGPVLAIFNQADGPSRLRLELPVMGFEGRSLTDRFDEAFRVSVEEGHVEVELPARTARLLTPL